jgi:beta-glucoside operon transcriptional antiterminator
VPGRTGTRVIRKIFNNNIVSAVDAAGVDVILVGSGVGYLTGRGHAVDEAKVEREFHLTGHARNGAFRVLLEIPYTVLKAVSRVAAFLADSHGFTLPPSAEVALADHIAQAIRRIEAGLPVANANLWDTKMNYPAEFSVALRVLDIVHEELGRRLPLDEAGFVTLHLVGAGLSVDARNAMLLGATLHEVVRIVERELGIVVDAADAASTRFLTHVKFVAQRLTRNQAYSAPLDGVLRELKDENPDVYACAAAIGEHLDSALDARITEEERMYLVIHLLKLRAMGARPDDDRDPADGRDEGGRP